MLKIKVTELNKKLKLVKVYNRGRCYVVSAFYPASAGSIRSHWLFQAPPLAKLTLFANYRICTGIGYA